MDENKNFTVETQPRWKSWALWCSVLGAVGLVLQATGALEAMGLTSESWNSVVTALGTILTAFGIVNNPTKHDTL
jgi:uncharacterized membrane protein